MQLGRRQQAAKAAADHDRLDGLGHGIADQRTIDIGIIDEAAEIAFDLDILAVAARVDPLLTFLQIFLPQPREIEFLFIDRCGVGHCRFRHPSLSVTAPCGSWFIHLRGA